MESVYILSWNTPYDTLFAHLQVRTHTSGCKTKKISVVWISSDESRIRYKLVNNTIFHSCICTLPPSRNIECGRIIHARDDARYIVLGVSPLSLSLFPSYIQTPWSRRHLESFTILSSKSKHSWQHSHIWRRRGGYDDFTLKQTPNWGTTLHSLCFSFMIIS